MAFDITTGAWISGFLFGALAAYLAQRRAKNPYLWFFIGFVFGIFGIMAIFLAPWNKKAASLPQAEQKPQPSIQGPKDKFWYYLDPSNQQHGPMSHDALTTAWKEGKLTSSTFVWNENLSEWKHLEEMMIFEK